MNVRLTQDMPNLLQKLQIALQSISPLFAGEPLFTGDPYTEPAEKEKI